MSELLSRGTNGTRGYTPEGGRMQGSVFPFRRRLQLVAGELRGVMGAYLAVLCAADAALAVVGVRTKHSLGELWVVGVLALAAAISERQRVPIGRNSWASISLIPILFAAVLFGPLAAMAVAAVSWLGAFEAPYMKWAVYTACAPITGAQEGRWVGSGTAADPVGLRIRPSVRTIDRPSGYRISACLSAVASSVLGSSSRGAEALRHVSAAEISCRGPLAR
jgi:hypothetical protein